jgi:methyltransferase (TIGR00027 family)
MDPAQASMTALGASMMRAVHTRHDRPALIDDPWGERLVSDAERIRIRELVISGLSQEAQEQLEGVESPKELATSLRLHASYGTVVIRMRCVEDALAAAVARGVQQYVIVGAGMDSFGLRRPEFARAVEVFEIDHPATQGLKRERIAECGISSPSGVHYVAADLSIQGIDEALELTGYEEDLPSFFSWLGVTAYLSREANLKTLRAIAACGTPNSELMFDYIDQGFFDSQGSDEDRERFRGSFAKISEPWVSGFRPSELEEDLRAVGLELVEDLSPEDLRVRYCAGREDGLSPASLHHIAHARIGGRAPG